MYVSVACAAAGTASSATRPRADRSSGSFFVVGMRRLYPRRRALARADDGGDYEAAADPDEGDKRQRPVPGALLDVRVEGERDEEKRVDESAEDERDRHRCRQVRHREADADQDQ